MSFPTPGNEWSAVYRSKAKTLEQLLYNQRRTTQQSDYVESVNMVGVPFLKPAWLCHYQRREGVYVYRAHSYLCTLKRSQMQYSVHFLITVNINDYAITIFEVY